MDASALIQLSADDICRTAIEACRLARSDDARDRAEGTLILAELGTMLTPTPKGLGQ